MQKQKEKAKDSLSPVKGSGVDFGLPGTLLIKILPYGACSSSVGETGLG